MTNINVSDRIARIFAKSEYCILYHPVRGEVDPATLHLNLPSRQVVVPVDPASDPMALGKSISEKVGNMNGVVLIPGRKFDRFGGRYGRGLGWYDRFLSVIPAGLVRIGICSQSEFSSTRLILREWDEVIDWVVVKGGNSYSFYETHARKR
jgi:5-formyltetrahydrofolate cyclo-ligase